MARALTDQEIETWTCAIHASDDGDRFAMRRLFTRQKPVKFQPMTLLVDDFETKDETRG